MHFSEYLDVCAIWNVLLSLAFGWNSYKAMVNRRETGRQTEFIRPWQPVVLICLMGFHDREPLGSCEHEAAS